MRAVVQRVSRAHVRVAQEIVGQINQGLVVLLGVAVDDTPDDAQYIVDKLVHLRVFSDADDKMNLSVKDVGGEVLVVSQFTLLGDCRKGRRPSFIAAARPDAAEDGYRRVIQGLRDHGLRVAEGRFQATMSVELVNEGPVTLLLDSRRLF